MRGGEGVDACHGPLLELQIVLAVGGGVGAGAEPLEQVVADAQGVRHRGQRRVHGARRREEARVDDVEVVDLVRAAVDVEHRRRRVRRRSGRCRTGARRRRAGSAGPGSSRSGSPWWQPRSPSSPLSLRSSRRCASSLWYGLGEVDAPGAVDRDAVVGVRQVLGGEPEVDRVLGHVVEREARGEPRRAGAQDVAVALAEHLDVPERQARSRRRPSSSR